MCEVVGCLLTPKEHKVVELTAQGYNSIEVGELAGMATKTASTHLQNARKKYEANNTTHLIAMLVSRGVIRFRI